MSKDNIISFTMSEMLTLKKVIVIQYDIANDTVTEDLYTTRDVSVTQLNVLRELTNERIDRLVVLTHTLATLESSVGDVTLQFSDSDKLILQNEVDCYLSMITDMLEDDDGTALSAKVQHIVDVNLLLQQLK